MKKSEGHGRKKARQMLRRSGYNTGGHVSRSDKAQDRAMVEKAVHAHERHDHPGKPLTKLKLKDGGRASGKRPHARADKPRRARGGKTGKHGTKVIIVNGAGGGHDRPVPVPVPKPVPVPAGGPPGAPMPPRGPMPPMAAGPGAMAGRPPMAKRGGATKRKTGGKVPKLTGGAGGATARMEKAKAYGAR